MCVRCFHATDHTGHNVSFFIAQQSGGSCDCGDFEAWRSPIRCPHHPEPLEASSSSSGTPITAYLPAIGDNSVPPVADYPFRAKIPNDLRERMTKTIGLALDFVLDTLDLSPDDTGVPKKEADVRIAPSADVVPREAWCVVVWNDDKHSFEEVIRLTVEQTAHTREEASALAYAIDDVGRAVVDNSGDLRKLMDVARAFAQVDLGVTVRRAYDTFREQMACVIIEWLLDLTRARVLSDTLVLRELITNELLSPRRTKESNTYASLQQISKVLPDDPDAARIDWLFMYHTKLWKKPRLNLKEIYASILSLSQDHKLAVGASFRTCSLSFVQLS
jgi:E3 ubiquitin-protein ligase UBR1